MLRWNVWRTFPTALSTTGSSRKSLTQKRYSPFLCSPSILFGVRQGLLPLSAGSHISECSTEGIGIVVQPVPKPSKDAQSSESGAKKVLLSDVYATAKTKLFGRPWNAQDYSYTIFMTVVHGLCLLAPATFSWPMVGLFFVSYFITGASMWSFPCLLVILGSSTLPFMSAHLLHVSAG